MSPDSLLIQQTLPWHEHEFGHAVKYPIHQPKHLSTILVERAFDSTFLVTLRRWPVHVEIFELLYLNVLQIQELSQYFTAGYTSQDRPQLTVLVIRKLLAVQ